MGGFEWIGGEPKANLRRGAEGAWARRAVLLRVNRMTILSQPCLTLRVADETGPDEMHDEMEDGGPCWSRARGGEWSGACMWSTFRNRHIRRTHHGTHTVSTHDTTSRTRRGRETGPCHRLRGACARRARSVELFVLICERCLFVLV